MAVTRAEFQRWAAREMKDCTLRVGAVCKLSERGLRPGVQKFLVVRSYYGRCLNAPGIVMDEHTRCVVAAIYQENMAVLLHLDTMVKFDSRPRNWEPADEEG